MKRIFVFLAVLLFAVPAFAQTAGEEIARLKEHLGMAPKVKITSEGGAIPVKDSLKVFIGTGLDTQVKANFERWITRWNKSQSKKYGTLERVGDLAQADVAMVRFVDSRATVTRYGGGSSSRYHNDFDVGVILGIPFPYPSRYPESAVPVYAYILANRGGQWDIAYRYVDFAEIRQSKRTGKYLWDQFQKMVKDSRKK